MGVPRTFSDYTTRRVLTSEWLDGEKLSQSQADDVGNLVNGEGVDNLWVGGGGGRS